MQNKVDLRADKKGDVAAFQSKPQTWQPEA